MFALLALLLAGPVQLDASRDHDRATTGAALLEKCNGFDDVAPTPLHATCFFYVAGFSDAAAVYDMVLVMGPGARPVMCIPERATYKQHVLVVLKFLREHPERLHEPQSGLVLDALSAAYPCAKKE